MSDKTRTTVTTIETHEIWIVRRAVPEPSEAMTITPEETVQLNPTASASSKLNGAAETGKQESEEIKSCIDEA